jgi:hypothetical protein
VLSSVERFQPTMSEMVIETSAELPAVAIRLNPRRDLVVFAADFRRETQHERGSRRSPGISGRVRARFR